MRTLLVIVLASLGIALLNTRVPADDKGSRSLSGHKAGSLEFLRDIHDIFTIEDDDILCVGIKKGGDARDLRAMPSISCVKK